MVHDKDHTTFGWRCGAGGQGGSRGELQAVHSPFQATRQQGWALGGAQHIPPRTPLVFQPRTHRRLAARRSGTIGLRHLLAARASAAAACAGGSDGNLETQGTVGVAPGGNSGNWETKELAVMMKSSRLKPLCLPCSGDCLHLGQSKH